MVEKRIKNFYNSVQISGELFPSAHAVKSKFLYFTVRGALGLAVAVITAKAVMFLAESMMKHGADKTGS